MSLSVKAENTFAAIGIRRCAAKCCHVVLMFAVYVCLCVCVCLCVSVCLCVCLSVCLCQVINYWFLYI